MSMSLKTFILDTMRLCGARNPQQLARKLATDRPRVDNWLAKDSAEYLFSPKMLRKIRQITGESLSAFYKRLEDSVSE